jgi:hypothetical protein
VLFLKLKCETYVGIEGSDSSECGFDTYPCLTLTYTINTLKSSSILIKTNTSCGEVTLSNSLSITSNNSNLAIVTCITSFKLSIGDYEITLSNIQFSFEGTYYSDLFFVNDNGKYTINNCLFKRDNSLKNAALNVSLFKIGNVNKDSGPTNCNFTHMSVTGNNGIFYLNDENTKVFTLRRCVFIYCFCNDSGGCIYVGCGIVKLTLNGCEFFHCSEVSRGGAIAQVNRMYKGGIIITSCIFENCTTTGANSKGGAIYCYPGKKEGFIMNETSFTRCSAGRVNGGRGGAVFFHIDENGLFDYFKLNGSLIFKSCKGSEGRHFFFEYETYNSSSICSKRSFNYTFSSEECTIYMSKKDSGISETMITQTCLETVGVCLIIVMIFIYLSIFIYLFNIFNKRHDVINLVMMILIVVDIPRVKLVQL